MSSKNPTNFFEPGTRVFIEHPERGVSGGGTVVGWPETLRKEFPSLARNGLIPICVDTRDATSFHPDKFREIEPWTGINQGILIFHKFLRRMPLPYFNHLPASIGVCVPPGKQLSKKIMFGALAEFRVDFLERWVGKPLRIVGNQNTPALYAISWHRKVVEKISDVVGKENIKQAFDDFRTLLSGRGDEQYITFVPLINVRWCHFNPYDGEIITLWPAGSHSSEVEKPEFEVGELVIYTGLKPVIHDASDGHRYTLVTGQLAYVKQLEGSRSRGTVWLSLPEWLGDRYHSECRYQVPLSSIRKNKYPPIPVGAEVKVMAKLNFRGQNLEGKKGRVILPTDAEGDVGVEFEEDVKGAGSLDGRGQDSRCLYLHVGSLESL